MKHEKISKYLGIVKIKDDELLEGENYVVYFQPYYFDDELLGECIGKGKTKEEALTQGIEILAKMLISMNKKLEKLEDKFNENIKEVAECFKTPFPIIPIEIFDDKIVNALVGKKENGDIWLIVE